MKRVALVLLVVLLPACGGSDDDGGEQGQRQGGQPATVERLRLRGGQFGYPSPFAYMRGPGLVYAGFMFDTLLWKDSSGTMVPWLAREWQHSPDGTEWRFTLRDEAKWHDGRPLTADDVVFTFDYLSKGPGRQTGVIHSQGTDVIKETVAEAPNRVVVRLNRPFAPFEETIAGRMLIIPKHVWSDVTEPAKLRGERAVLGSGPYRLESADDAAGRYLFTANEAHFFGAPLVRRLELSPAPDQLAALQRGDVDAGTFFLEEQGPPEQALAAFSDESRYGRITGPGEWTRALHINMSKGLPYNDKRFRQALAYAIDRKDLVERILLGRGEPGSLGILAPSHPMAAKDLPAYDRDVGRARTLLDEAGLRDTNGDGTRELPDGRPFAPGLLTSSQFSPKTAEVVKEYLREVGIQVQITSLDGASADAATTRGSYDLALIGYGALGGDPDIPLRIRLSSRVPAKSFFSTFGYVNPQYEDLAARQSAMLDANRRKDLVQQIQRIVSEDVPAIPLYMPTRLLIFDKRSFDAWYFTPGGVWGAYPGPENKQAFVTGTKTLKEAGKG
ncbi:MAG: ABC transporter substrate-binding protein [Actinomycetota bacterium]|nr:ABC transporter substrate-binding protein [Actinomycetota bacterium]